MYGERSRKKSENNPHDMMLVFGRDICLFYLFAKSVSLRRTMRCVGFV